MPIIHISLVEGRDDAAVWPLRVSDAATFPWAFMSSMKTASADAASERSFGTPIAWRQLLTCLLKCLLKLCGAHDVRSSTDHTGRGPSALPVIGGFGSLASPASILK